MFTDRVVSPSYSPDVAAATRHLVEHDGAPPGVYHCVNAGHATWETSRSRAARLLGVEPRLKPLTIDQLTLRRARPRYCALATRSWPRRASRCRRGRTRCADGCGARSAQIE